MPEFMVGLLWGCILTILVLGCIACHMRGGE